MRQNKFIVTKNHFLLIAGSNEVGDELWAGHVEFNKGNFENKQLNAIGFIVSGTVNSFMNTSDDLADISWEPYISVSAPLMLPRKNFTNLGIVSTSERSMFGSIQVRENVFSGKNISVFQGILEEQEKVKIISEEEETVNVSDKCKIYRKRDLNNFILIPEEPLNIHTILDSEIEIEGM